RRRQGVKRRVDLDRIEDLAIEAERLGRVESRRIEATHPVREGRPALGAQPIDANAPERTFICAPETGGSCWPHPDGARVVATSEALQRGGDSPCVALSASAWPRHVL